MAVLYQNQHYSEACYNEVELYMHDFPGQIYQELWNT